MFLKWIVCDVPDKQRSALSEAQQQWQSIQCATGLVAQLGGWFPAGRSAIPNHVETVNSHHRPSFLAGLRCKAPRESTACPPSSL